MHGSMGGSWKRSGTHGDGPESPEGNPRDTRQPGLPVNNRHRASSLPDQPRAEASANQTLNSLQGGRLHQRLRPPAQTVPLHLRRQVPQSSVATRKDFRAAALGCASVADTRQASRPAGKSMKSMKSELTANPNESSDRASSVRAVNNWSRWGTADERGALNLITSATTLRAVGLVMEGRVVSLCRLISPRSAPDRSLALETTIRSYSAEPGAGAMVEDLTMAYHGYDITHLDALCHVWAGGGMWNGAMPGDVVGPGGSSWADITHWAGGILTRGVLADIPAIRSSDYVGVGEPVGAKDLEAAIDSLEHEPNPGDALVVRCGRTAWEADNGRYGAHATELPGLDESCLDVLRRWDFSLLVSDMVDAKPKPQGRQWTAHSALYTLGVGLIDNADLDELAEACSSFARSEFLLIVNALPIAGGSGSPVNPVAVL